MAAPLTFGGWLKRRRQGLGLTQKELAYRVGYALVTLRKVEAGELRPSVQLARKLAEALELAPEDQAQFVRIARDEAYWDDLTLPTTPMAAQPAPVLDGTRAGTSLAAAEGPAGAPGHARPKHNLPAPTTALIGREEELAELAHLLADPRTRLVTILSAGGMGKTSLALAAALAHVEQFADGVCWVPLAPLLEPKDLVLATATALRLQLQGERTPEQQVGDYLQDKHLLLVLDNFEHLLDGAPLVGELLARAPQLWILVTSRQRLKLSSESVIFLDGLRSPAEQGTDAREYPAVQMFLLHAHQVRRHYEPHEQELAGIAAVCRLLHGMPLGILLAATWTRVISPAQIAEEIAKDLGFLQTDMPDVPARQRSLRAVFLHTWGRLGTPERDVFMRLSVFRGGATIAAAQEVGGASVAVLAALIDNALLRRLPDGRYEIHELLRQFAQEQLEQDEQAAVAVRDAHSIYFSRFLAQRETAITCTGERRALQEVAAELDNIRAAWAWAAERQHSSLLKAAAAALIQFCDCQGRYHEGVELCEQAVARLLPVEAGVETGVKAGGEREPALAILLAAGGWLYIRLGRYDQAHQAFTRSGSIYSRSGTVPPPGYPGEPVVGLALLADVLGNYADAVALAHQALAAAEASGDIFSESVAYYVLASTAYAQGEYGAARREAGRAYELAVEIDSRWMMAYTAIIQGNVAGACGEYGAAYRYYAHSHTIQRELGNPEGMAIAQLSLARLEAGQRSYHEAERLFQDSYALYREINDPGGQIRALLGLGDIAQVQGSGAQASSYFCTGLALAIAIHSLPLLLLLFTPIGELLASAGELALATSAWLLVTQHAAGERAMQQRARKDLHRRGAKGAAPAMAQQVDGAAGSAPFALAALLRDKLAAITEASEYHAAGPAAPKTRGAPALVEPLSERELEILRLIAEGMTNQQIADTLYVVVGTVKVHNHHIFGKLGVSNRTQALARARALNLLA